MLYLIEPDGTVLSNPLTVGDVRVLQRRDRRDPATLAWEDAEGIPPHEVLTAALRHGVDIRRGLMVDARFVDQLLEPEKLRVEAQEQARVREQLLQVSVGARQEDEEQDRRARQRAEDAIQSSRTRAEKLRSTDVDPKLDAAWTRMGGFRNQSGSHQA